MILHENSLYKDQTEKAAFIADKEKCANSLVYNFFGFLSLYNISEKKTQMKRYLSNEKDTSDVKLIGDENADVSLAVKLAVDSTGLPFRTAKYMLKLLTKINQRTLKADDIDENAIRELVKYSKLQTSFKPSPALVSIISDFMDGTTNLTFLGYHLFKVQKRFTDVNQEFVDYYKKGHYNTLYSDYQHGKLTCPDGIPQSQVKTVSNLTKIYVMNGGTQNPAPVTTTQPTPTVASVTPTQTVTPTATITQTVPVAQAAPVVPQPTQTPVPVALPQPKIVTSPIATPVVVQQPVYKYNDIVQVIESLKEKNFKIQDCDVSSVKLSVSNFNPQAPLSFVSTAIAFDNCTTEQEHIKQLEYILIVFSSFVDAPDISDDYYKHFISAMFVSILMKFGDGTLNGDVGITTYTSKFTYRPLLEYIRRNGLFRSLTSYFQIGLQSTSLKSADDMYKYVSSSDVSNNVKRTVLEIFASMIYGDKLTTDQFFNAYKRFIKATNCKTFVRAFLINAVPENRTDLILELLKIIGITNAENVSTPNGIRFEYDAMGIPPVSETITKLFAEYNVFVEVKKPLDLSGVSQADINRIEYDNFYDYLMNDTVDLGGRYVSLLDNYVGGLYNNIRPMPETFVGLYDRLKETIEYINNKYDKNISTSDSNLDNILFMLFSQSTNNLVGIYYKAQVFSPASLKEMPLARVKPILDIMLNFYSRFNGSISDYPLFLYKNSVGRTNINKMYTDDTSNETVQYYANGIVDAILKNKEILKLTRVASHVTNTLTNLGSGNFNTRELYDAYYIASAFNLYFLGKKMSSGVDTANIVKTSVIQDANNLWQATSDYKRGVRDKLLKYKDALPALGKMLEMCDLAFKGVEDDVESRYAADSGEAFDEAIRFMILGEHPKYKEMSTYGVSSFLNVLQIQTPADSPMYAMLMHDIVEKMFLDPEITDEACAAMFTDIVEDSRYNLTDSAFLVMIETLENPAYAKRLNGISKAKAFSTVQHRLLIDTNDFFTLVDRNSNIVTGKEINARVEKLFKPDSEIAPLLKNIVERTIKSKGDLVHTIREFDRWHLIGMLPDNDFRKECFKELDGYNAVKGREVIAYSESFKNVSLRSGITKFDVLGTNMTKDEMKIVYDFLMQYATNAITGRLENFMASSYINVVQMIKRIEDVHGFTSKLTAAKLEKIRTNGVIAFSSESKGGDKVFRGAGFTLSDMMKSDFPIVPNIGRRKGDFAKAIERNQPSPDPLNYVVKPHFLQEKNYRNLFDMILDGDLYDGNDSKKLQELRPLCVKPVVMSQDEMNKRTKQLMTTRRSGNAHGEAIPKITSAFDVDFNMTNMEFKPHTKEALENFVAINKVDKNDAKQYLKVCFHGTGSMAASFILRFGFKDTGVVVQGAGNAGQMLGDGMYLATNIDKAGLYAWDGGVSHDNYGEKGYIFICEAALGTRDKHYKYADPTVKGFSKLRSREWCLKQPRQQVWIKKAYQVDIVKVNTREYGYGVDWLVMPDPTIDY